MVKEKRKGFERDSSTILLRKDVIDKLKEAKDYSRQTYNELLEKMAELYIEAKRKNSVDNVLEMQRQSFQDVFRKRQSQVI